MFPATTRLGGGGTTNVWDGTCWRPLVKLDEIEILFKLSYKIIRIGFLCILNPYIVIYLVCNESFPGMG